MRVGRRGALEAAPSLDPHRRVPHTIISSTAGSASSGLIDQHLQALPADPSTLIFKAPGGGPVYHSRFYDTYFKPAVAAVLTTRPNSGSTTSGTPPPV